MSVAVGPAWCMAVWREHHPKECSELLAGESWFTRNAGS